MSTEEIDPMSLPAYEESSDTEEQPIVGSGVANKRASYVGIHAMGFRDLLLKSELQKAIVDCGFEHPSEVQQQCIPQAILGMDVLCQAKSGMGKTAVFVIAVLQQLDLEENKNNNVSVLVLCHTRELAYQIKNEFVRFSKNMKEIKTAVFYGGSPKNLNVQTLETEHPQIVVGTPGRILQLVEENHLKLNHLKHFILDECDNMLEKLDMRRDVQLIFRQTPQNKQVMMFSATLSKDVRPVCKKFMHNPLEIFIDDEKQLTLHGLQQHYVKVMENQKNKSLSDMLDSFQFNQVVIFVNSVQRAKALNNLLNSVGFPSITIHSGMKQEERIKQYKAFKDFEKRVMVATDVLSRGIDVEKVNIVFNYDMPDSTETYLHRVGRAGRFGTKGLAISFISSQDDSDRLEDIQKRFEVKISDLPDHIDPSSYIHNN